MLNFEDLTLNSNAKVWPRVMGVCVRLSSLISLGLSFLIFREIALEWGLGRSLPELSCLARSLCGHQVCTGLSANPHSSSAAGALVAG